MGQLQPAAEQGADPEADAGGGNPVTIPPYSGMRLEWQVFDVPQPSLTLNVSNSTPILHWTGLTNVTYTVQRSTNLLSTWSTAGWVPATQTNLAFTDRLIGPLQFYRLAVPRLVRCDEAKILNRRGIQSGEVEPKFDLPRKPKISTLQNDLFPFNLCGPRRGRELCDPGQARE